MHGARPLAQDDFEFSAGVGTYAFQVDGGREEDVLPFLDVGARRGFGERLDAGVRLTSFSMLGADVNYALYLGDRVALSVDPGASILMGPVLLTYLWLPLLLDLDLGPTTTLTLTARMGYVIFDDLQGEDVGIQGEGRLVGLGIGLRQRMSETLLFMPELHVVRPSEGSWSEDALISLSLGFSW